MLGVFFIKVMKYKYFRQGKMLFNQLFFNGFLIISKNWLLIKVQQIRVYGRKPRRWCIIRIRHLS